MNYYERHLGDYAKSAGHLSMLEHGAYTLLLDRYYGTEAAIPADQVYRVARARTRDERAAVDAVLQEFFTLTDGAWHKNRCEEEIEKAARRINAARENGKGGGRPRKPKTEPEPGGSGTETQEKPNGFLLGSENETQSKAHHTPYTNKIILNGNGERKVGSKPPRHGATSTKRGTVFIVKGTPEWDAYAEDYRQAHFTEPVPNQDGGKWFKTLGEAAE